MPNGSVIIAIRRNLKEASCWITMPRSTVNTKWLSSGSGIKATPNDELKIVFTKSFDWRPLDRVSEYSNLVGLYKKYEKASRMPNSDPEVPFPNQMILAHHYASLYPDLRYGEGIRGRDMKLVNSHYWINFPTKK